VTDWWDRFASSCSAYLKAQAPLAEGVEGVLLISQNHLAVQEPEVVGVQVFQFAPAGQEAWAQPSPYLAGKNAVCLCWLQWVYSLGCYHVD
jgi:hypothetical protein